MWLIKLGVLNKEFSSMSTSKNMCCNTYLQSLLCRAARLLLQLARLQGFDVFITFLVAVIQQVLFGLQQTLARCHIPDADGKSAVG